jgi:hypothetical protein
MRLPESNDVTAGSRTTRLPESNDVTAGSRTTQLPESDNAGFCIKTICYFLRLLYILCRQTSFSPNSSNKTTSVETHCCASLRHFFLIYKARSLRLTRHSIFAQQ